MSARYVRIPFGSRIKYPAHCPFTGQKNPRSSVKISRRETQMFLPIPFIGFFRLGKRGTAVFPSTRLIGLVAKFFAVSPLLCLVAGFGSLILIKNNKSCAGCYFLGCIASLFVFRVIHWLWLRRVRIVRIGMSSLEVRFASPDYAKEFCRLNDFHCGTNPTARRPTPITVNNVR